jgi:hypothetical protein
MPREMGSRNPMDLGFQRHSTTTTTTTYTHTIQNYNKDNAKNE